MIKYMPSSTPKTKTNFSQPLPFVYLNDCALTSVCRLSHICPHPMNRQLKQLKSAGKCDTISHSFRLMYLFLCGLPGCCIKCCTCPSVSPAVRPRPPIFSK